MASPGGVRSPRPTGQYNYTTVFQQKNTRPLAIAKGRVLVVCYQAAGSVVAVGCTR